MVDRDGLENRCTFTGTVSSNLTLSASSIESKQINSVDAVRSGRVQQCVQLIELQTLVFQSCVAPSTEVGDFANLWSN